MPLQRKAKLEKLTWKDVREDVMKVNPKFAKIIDELNPGPKYWLAKATYPYGSEVMKRSLLMLPNKEGNLVPITDSSIDTDIREGLSYNLNSNPVSLVMKNSFEIFLPLEDRTIPMAGLIYPGAAFGAWRVLNPSNTQHPIFIWDMTAGARSVFMLPKITEAKRHLQLKKAYGLTFSAPKSLIDHWEIFREIANHPNFETPWNAEILYFSKHWFTHLENQTWKPFYYYFHDAAWGGSEVWRNQFMWNLVFSLILKDYQARPSAYIMDTVKYLLNMGVAASPGLAPSKNNLGGPFETLQKIYIEKYGIKNYPPIIMQTDVFNEKDTSSQPVYYSLQFPNAAEFKPNTRARTSIISDLHEIRSLMVRYEHELLTDKLNLSGTCLGEIFRHVKFDYFHSGVDLHTGMRNSTEIPVEDESFTTTFDGMSHKSFPDSSSFSKGCIRISHKETTNS